MMQEGELSSIRRTLYGPKLTQRRE